MTALGLLQHFGYSGLLQRFAECLPRRILVEPLMPTDADWAVLAVPSLFSHSWFYTEMAIPPRFGPFHSLRRFHPVEGFSPRRGVPPHSSSFPRPSYPPQSSCLSPPRHLSLKPTLLPMKPCFSPEWYLHTSPDKSTHLDDLGEPNRDSLSISCRRPHRPDKMDMYPYFRARRYRFRPAGRCGDTSAIA